MIVGSAVGGLAIARRLLFLSSEFEITLVDRARKIPCPAYRLPGYIAEHHADGTASVAEVRMPGFPFDIDAKEFAWKEHKIEFLWRHETLRIERNAKQIIVRDVENDSKKTLSYDRLILSPGAAPVRPQIPGIDLPQVRTLRTQNDADAILKSLSKKRKDHLPVVVMGGGLPGLEIVSALHAAGHKVVLLEAAKQILIGADAEMVAPLHRELLRQGVELRSDVCLVRLIEQPDDSIRLELNDDDPITARLVVVASGVRPEVSLALDAGLELGITGGLRVNDRMQTGDPDIYAIGDAVEVVVRREEKNLPTRSALAGSVLHQAIIAADHLHGFRHHPYQTFGGTLRCRLFETTFAQTGSSEKQLRRERIRYEKIYLHAPEHYGALDETKRLTLKVLFSPNDGILLGAQAVGTPDAAALIDILATAVRFEATVRQLDALELGFDPSHASPRGLVHFAGDVASDLLDGLVHNTVRKEIKHLQAHQTLLDIRPSNHSKRLSIDGAISLPMEELFQTLDRLDKAKEYIVIGQDGLDGYRACRFLILQGFHAKNFSGGFLTFRDLLELGLA